VFAEEYVGKRSEKLPADYCEATTMDIKQKKAILKDYLGFSPAWFDLRKKEILNDNINIKQWQINMNYLIYEYGSIYSSEENAFDHWAETFNNPVNIFEEYLEEHVTPILLNISDIYLPRILFRDQDRNWFLAAYPDVFEYFYPQANLLAENFDTELRRVKEHVKAVTADHEKMEQYLTTGKGNQTIYLVRMKTFYKNELNKNLLLCC